MSMSGSGNDCRVFVGNLPKGVTPGEVSDIFHKFGKIVHLSLKNQDREGVPFAFLEFEDPLDAADAVRKRDGYKFDGQKIRVEFPRGGRSNRSHQHYGYNNGRRGGGGERFSRSQHRVHVSGLPSSGSWQDLKDHMRDAGEVCFADVNKDGTGVVEFIRSSDMAFAIKKLNDTKFKSHEGETSYIHLTEASRGRSQSRGRSNSRSRSASPDRSSRKRSRRASPASTVSPKRKSRASRSRSPRSRERR